MSPEAYGLIVSAAILVPTLVFVVVRTAESLRANSYEWGALHFTVRRSNSFVGSGDRYSREDFSNLDFIAREVLAEWFDSPEGERELVRDSHRQRYSCTVQFRGRVGQAWG